MLTRVKICGITTAEDARVAVEAGADALGFMLFPGSRRAVTPERVAEIAEEVPREVLRVGVFVNPTAGEVREARETAGLEIIQLHGEEPPEFCHALAGVAIWKAFRVSGPEVLAMLPRYGDVDAWLLDGYMPGERGGTGETFNWDLACQAVGLGRPIVLAGGLTPENVVEAVRRVRPAWVDVSSGVEESAGRKDPARIRAFVEAVRGAG